MITRAPWALTFCLITLDALLDNTDKSSKYIVWQTNAPNKPQTHIECSKVSHQIYILPVSQNPKFHSLSLYDQPLSYYPLSVWDQCAKWLQMTLNTKRSKVPHIILQLPPESHISLLFALQTPIFELQAILRQVHRMTPKWPWKLEGQSTTIPESQISIRLALQPAVFQLQDILRQMDQMTAKWPWTLKGQRYPIYMLQLPPIPKFHPVSLYSQPLSNYRSFWNKCT